MIRTKLHKARELAPDDPVLAQMAGAPNYVVDSSTMLLLAEQSEAIQASIVALREAGVLRLPFATLGLELEGGDGMGRYFIIYDEAEWDGGPLIRARTVWMNAAQTAINAGNGPTYIDTANPGPEGKIILRHNMGGEQPAFMEVAHAGFRVAAVLLNTAVLDKEIVEAPAKLNRRREQSGKPGIQRHTILRLGTVFDRTGAPVSYGGGVDGRQLPHLRAGHVRHQAHGPGMQDRKLIYIDPILVNFREGIDPSEVRQPKRIVTK